MNLVREPSVAGMFYSASPKKLQEDIQSLLNFNKPAEKFENIFGIISPHAGYMYSGRSAAFAYNAVSGNKFKTVVIISPSHREYFPGISIYNGNAYKTPLGELSVNKELAKKIISNSKIIFEGLNGHRTEHALEVQLPFLQMVMKDFTIVPIVMGDQSRIFIDELASRLSNAVDDETLIVASSDLSHFYNKENADKLDSVIEKHINNFDYETLQKDLENGKCEACGGGGIVVLMKTADLLDRRKSKVLSRTNSGDVTGDKSEVVGYLSAVIYG